MPNNPGLLAVSLYKPSDGTTYQLDGANIAPDSEGYRSTANVIGAVKGSERVKNRTHTFVIRHNDGTFHANLTGDADFENRSWRLAAAEMDGFLLWYETVKVVVPVEKAEVDPESGDPYPYEVRLRCVSASAAIARGTNLLYAYNKTQGFASAWQDSDSNNEADGYSQSSTDSRTWTSGTLNIVNASAAAFYETIIVFPISGLDLTLSVDNTVNSGTCLILIQQNDFSSSMITNASFTMSGARDSIEDESESAVYSISAKIANSSVPFDVDVSDPAIRLNGSSTYIDA